MARRLTDISVDGSTFEIDLAALVGSPITRVRGYLASEFGEPSFKLTRIDFANGEHLGVEGEHDFPYLVGEAGNHKPDVLQALYDDDE